MATRKKKLSPVIELLQHVWDNSLLGTGHSWERLNQELRQILLSAIRVGYKFKLDDFRDVRARYNGGFWFGRDGEHGLGEQFYSAACKVDNLSACQSFENWVGRPPFILDGDRMHIGYELRIKTTEANNSFALRRGKVTSFSRPGLEGEPFVVVCVYPRDVMTWQRPEKVLKVYKPELKKRCFRV